MDIKSSKINLSEKKETNKINNTKNVDASVKFTDELKNINPKENQVKNIDKENNIETTIKPEEAILQEKETKPNNTIEQEREKINFQNINQNIHKTILSSNTTDKKNSENILKAEENNNIQKDLLINESNDDIIKDKKTENINNKTITFEPEKDLITKEEVKVFKAIKNRNNEVEPKEDLSIRKEIDSTVEQHEELTTDNELNIIELQERLAKNKKLNIAKPQDNLKTNKELNIIKPKEDLTINKELNVTKPQDELKTKKELNIIKPEEDLTINTELNITEPKDKLTTQKEPNIVEPQEELTKTKKTLEDIIDLTENKKNNIKNKEINKRLIKDIEASEQKDNQSLIEKNIDNKNKKVPEKPKQAAKDKDEIKKTKTNIFAKENIQINQALSNLNNIVKELNQSEDNKVTPIKKEEFSTDNKDMINNDFNIQENKDLLPQMNPNMNFSGDGQPFSSFMNNEENTKKDTKTVLRSSAQELAEEAAILSTMAENIAIANKNQVTQAQDVVKTVNRQDGIKKVNTKTNIVVETVVKYDTIIMNEADVEVFANLVENQEVNMKNLTTQATEKSVQISKTLADMLAKAMEKNQPVRIDFDNNISVIIKISRDGKITADFLPSSQVAEAYLKENLPLLRQRFNDNNIEYDSLNQRERRESGKENNRRKGRNNE